MAQDQIFLTSSNNGGDDGSSSSNKSSKNSKPKKTPQRGLGVAQLERIRVEEQRKEALQAANNAVGDPIPTPYTIQSPAPNTMLLNEEEPGWPRLLNGNGNGNGFGFGHHPQVNNVDRVWEPNGAGLGGPQRSYPFQRYPSPSVVNAAAPSISLSVSSSQIEHPSIQSVRGNNSHTSSWSDDDKNVGMKRACPFSLESPPPPTPPPYFCLHPRSRSADEFPTWRNEPGYNNYIIRDGPSNSCPVPEQKPSEDAKLIGDFLSLAPPVASSPPLSSTTTHPLDYFGHQGPDLSDNISISLSSQKIHHRVGLGSSNEQQTFNFFPTKSQAEQQASRNGDGENGEKLDLNLKL